MDGLGWFDSGDGDYVMTQFEIKSKRGLVLVFHIFPPPYYTVQFSVQHGILTTEPIKQKILA